MRQNPVPNPGSLAPSAMLLLHFRNSRVLHALHGDRAVRERPSSVELLGVDVASCADPKVQVYMQISLIKTIINLWKVKCYYFRDECTLEYADDFNEPRGSSGILPLYICKQVAVDFLRGGIQRLLQFIENAEDYVHSIRNTGL